MNLLLIIAALFIVTETINPEVDDAKKIQKNEAIVETVETKPSEEIISEAKAAAEAQAAAEAAAEAEAAAQAQAAAEAEAKAAEEINYLKIALYIILLLAVLSGALLYFRKRDKSPLESKIIPPEQKEQEQPIQEEIQPETKEQQPIQEETQPETKEEQTIDNANKEPTNFEETNEDEKK